MPSQTLLLAKLVQSSVSIAKAAGSIIRDIMDKGDLGIVQKSQKNDFQTEADREAQLCIVSSLQKYFPKATIIGEEDVKIGEKCGKIIDLPNEPSFSIAVPNKYYDILEEDIVVWVDPLDGTREYVQGLVEHVTVLIGIAVNGKAIAGVIHQPYYNYNSPGSEVGRTVWGIVGGDVGGIELKPPPADRHIVITARSHSSTKIKEAIKSVSPDEELSVGGCGYPVLLLLEGLAQSSVFASPGTMKWDTCAPQAILEAAGGRFTDIHGETYPYNASTSHNNSRGLVVTVAGQDHKMFLKKIPQTIKDKLMT